MLRNMTMRLTAIINVMTLRMIMISFAISLHMSIFMRDAYPKKAPFIDLAGLGLLNSNLD